MKTAILALLIGASLCAASAARATTPEAPIVATGAVPDEAAKAAILARLREVFGAERVVDQISVGGVTSPPRWAEQVQRSITPHLKGVSAGSLSVDGTQVALNGTVASDQARKALASEVAASFNNQFVVKNGLAVAAGEQQLLDQTLGNRIVEFESGKATLTPTGQQILDEMAKALQSVKGRRVEIIGHTDSDGSRVSNLALSQARANEVQRYLVAKGGDAAMLSTTGMGPDRPVASNASPEGRARNRRIEFRVLAP
ncbi:OmpA family protein [Niveibacterium sp. 24ML]|uniref:OmpA family protein n=1 Tax=Niveibacterium sp. 24ML TaxID=2985512 RepID=UPI00226E484E|nr:OmpA family protein [Niveibacterium sp. 24ML]MCX9155016.1 OmpA family protein [Niveibacterium sp. 24ML]